MPIYPRLLRLHENNLSQIVATDASLLKFAASDANLSQIATH